MDNALLEPEKNLEFEAGGNQKYEVKVILTARYTANRQTTTTKYQAFIISFYGKAIQKKKTPRSLHQQSYTSGI